MTIKRMKKIDQLKKTTTFLSIVTLHVRDFHILSKCLKSWRLIVRMFEVGGTWYQNRVWTYIPLDKKKVYLITARALSGQALLILSLNYFSTKRCYSFFIYNDKFRLGPIQPSRQLFTGFNDLINTLLLIFKYENYP